MSDTLKSPWIIPPITFYEQYRSCKSMSARPSACLLGHTDRPNLRMTARWRGKALSPSPLFPPLTTRSNNYGQLLCARGSPFSRFVRPYPLSAFHSLLPFHPSSVGGSRPQSEASLGRRFCRRILVRRAVTFNRPYNESSYESHEFIYGRGRLKVPAQSER